MILFATIKGLFKRVSSSDKVKVKTEKYNACTVAFITKNDLYSGKVRIEIEDKEMEDKVINLLKLLNNE